MRVQDFVETIANSTKGQMAQCANELEQLSVDQLKDIFINLTVLQATVQQVRLKKKQTSKNELSKRKQWEIQQAKELAKDQTGTEFLS